MTFSRLVYDTAVRMYLRGRLSRMEFAKAVTGTLWEQAAQQAARARQTPEQAAIRERAIRAIMLALAK